MTARFTKILILLQLAAAVGMAVFAMRVFHVDSPWLAALLGVALVCAFRLLITINNFFLAWLYGSVTPVECRLGWRQAFRLFAQEFKASMLTSSWTMPFHAFANRIAKNPQGLPVLLIHGYGGNSGFWHSFSKKLTQSNITHYAVDLEPVFGDIEAFVPTVQRAIEAICEKNGNDKIIVVAHSMGGLVARAYLCAHGAARIAKIVTLGTPHHGTSHADFAPGLNSRQMQRRGTAAEGMPSEWLESVGKREPEGSRKLLVSVYTHHDNIIAPQTSCHLPGARNIALHGIGHVALVFDLNVQQLLIREILDLQSSEASLPRPVTV